MAAPLTVPRDEQDASVPRPRSAARMVTIALVVVTCLGAAAYFAGLSKEKVQSAWQFLNKEADSLHEKKAIYEPPVPVLKPSSNTAWDGSVAVNRDEQTAIGFRFATVKAQSN